MCSYVPGLARIADLTLPNALEMLWRVLGSNTPTNKTLDLFYPRGKQAASGEESLDKDTASWIPHLSVQNIISNTS